MTPIPMALFSSSSLAHLIAHVPDRMSYLLSSLLIKVFLSNTCLVLTNNATNITLWKTWNMVFCLTSSLPPPWLMQTKFCQFMSEHLLGPSTLSHPHYVYFGGNISILGSCQNVFPNLLLWVTHNATAGRTIPELTNKHGNPLLYILQWLSWSESLKTRFWSFPVQPHPSTLSHSEIHRGSMCSLHYRLFCLTSDPFSGYFLFISLSTLFKLSLTLQNKICFSSTCFQNVREITSVKCQS